MWGAAPPSASCSELLVPPPLLSTSLMWGVKGALALWRRYPLPNYCSCFSWVVRCQFPLDHSVYVRVIVHHYLKSDIVSIQFSTKVIHIHLNEDLEIDRPHKTDIMYFTNKAYNLMPQSCPLFETDHPLFLLKSFTFTTFSTFNVWQWVCIWYFNDCPPPPPPPQRAPPPLRYSDSLLPIARSSSG